MNTNEYFDVVYVGELILSKDLIAKVEIHRNNVIAAHPDKKEMLENAPFGALLSDYLIKFA